MIHEYDVVVVGGGIAGLHTALIASEKCRVAVVSKVHVTRSHSVAAQGGIAASLGNEEEDHWEWHMYDTVKGGDYLADQKAVEILAKEAPNAIITSEVLHAIVSHEQPPSNEPNHRILTKEAGIVGIADALDMEAGRARIPFQAGKIDIHAVSALSIEKVEVECVENSKNGEKPINIKIKMSNSAGVFQIDELLKPRIVNSELEQFFHVIAEITGEKENRIIEKFEI